MCNSISTADLTNRRNAILFVFGLSQLLLLGATGCRSTTDNQIDLLERELRVQEDYIYELEGYVVDYSEKLRECRGCSPSQTAVYSEEVYRPSSKSSSPKKSAPSRSSKEKSIIEDPQEDLPAPDDGQDVEQPQEISPENMEVPEIELEMGEPLTDIEDPQALQQVAAVELEFESADGRPLSIPDPVDFASNEQELEPTLPSESNDVELLAEQRTEESSVPSDRRPQRLEVKHLFRGEGDDTPAANLLTVVEALDDNSEPVDLDGEVSLMVMTPGEDGKLKRLKRWNFTPEETVTAWQSSDLGDGLHLELPLEEVELPAAPLELWVRLLTSDGRKLLTQLPFEAQLLADLGDGDPEPLPLAKNKSDSANPLRTTAGTISDDRQLKLAKEEQPSSQGGWRSSKQHDLATDGLAAANGWTKQAPGRLAYQRAQVEQRSSGTSSRSAAPSTGKPVWTAGRSQYSGLK